MRANISLFVIGFSLAGSIGGAATQYLPPQPPPVGYPPPGSYPSPASPPHYPGADPLDSDQYEDPYNDLYPPRPPRLVYPSPYGYPAGPSRYSGVGTFVSSGCIRLTNEDVEDLYSRVTVGTTVIVLPGANTAASQLRRRY